MTAEARVAPEVWELVDVQVTVTKMAALEGQNLARTDVMDERAVARLNGKIEALREVAAFLERRVAAETRPLVAVVS